MAKPFFSVVIPTYNRSADVCRAVKSILQQTDQDFEIIVVDDAGTDNTVQKLLTLGDSRIHYIRQEQNMGAKAARNRGIQAAKGQWLCLLDSDDEWLPQRLEFLRETIQSQSSPHNNVFWSSLVFNRGNGVTSIKPERSKPKDQSLFDYLLCNDGLMQTSTLAVSLKVAQKINFNTNVLGHDDYQFLYDLEQAGYEFVHDNRPQVIWNNEDDASRVSYANRLKKYSQWIEIYGDAMSPKALAAYKATNLAMCYSGLGLIKSYGYIVQALIKRAIPVRRGILMLLRVTLPAIAYSKLVSTLSH